MGEPAEVCQGSWPGNLRLPALKIQSLDILWGQEDQTSDVPSCLAALTANGVAHRPHPYPASGHNLLDDYDGAAAAIAIADVLAPQEPTQGA